MSTKTVEIIKRADQITTEWSGGTTTQLAIHPPGASYAQRAFRWRLSSATVNAPESTFTPLPGFRRILMILSGAMQLTHAGHHEAKLQAFAQDAFDGAWTTSSVGRAVDFNLMTAEGVRGEVSALVLPAGEASEIAARGIAGAARPASREGRQDAGNRETLALYVYEGGAAARIGAHEYLLNEKDVLLLRGETVGRRDEPPPVVVRASGSAQAIIIVTRIAG